MNSPIRRVSVAVIALFASLLAMVNYRQVVQAGDLRDDPRNGRVLLRTDAVDRGAIAVETDGKATSIADSVETDPKPEKRPIYSRGKIAAEQALLELHRDAGLPLVITRPGIVLGAGTAMQHSGYGLWTRDNRCIGWGHGDAPIPGVWVDDVADAFVKIVAYAKDDLHGKALNLCAQPPITPREYVNELGRVTGRAITFHPRGLGLSQAMEIGKWLVKKLGRKPGVEFPSWRDLKSRAVAPVFTADIAREKLGWKPVQEREAFLDRCVRVYRAPSAG